MKYILKFVAHFQKWEEMEISETTDDGKTVKSVIRVPMQVITILFVFILYK